MSCPSLVLAQMFTKAPYECRHRHDMVRIGIYYPSVSIRILFSDFYLVIYLAHDYMDRINISLLQYQYHIPDNTGSIKGQALLKAM